MRILHFDYDNPNHPRISGGGALRNFEIYKRFAIEHTIKIVTSCFNKTRVDGLGKIEYIRTCESDKRFLNRLNYSIKSRNFLKQYVPNSDIIIEDFTPFSPVFIGRNINLPIIASIQNIFHFELLKNYKLLGIALFMLETAWLKKHKNFIVVSESTKNKLIKINKRIENIEVIPNGVDEKLFKLPIIEENFILFLGRIDIYQKGLDYLLKVFKEVLKKFDNVKLVIAGDGSDYKKIVKIVKNKYFENKVSLVGRVDKEEKMNLLSKCLFLVMPSRFESWGMSALEASAAGKAVVGYDIEGLNYVVKDNSTGCLVEKNNEKKLFDAICFLLRDPNKRRKLGLKGRGWASNFLWDTISLRQENFYKRIIDGSKK